MQTLWLREYVTHVVIFGTSWQLIQVCVPFMHIRLCASEALLHARDVIIFLLPNSWISFYTQAAIMTRQS